MTPEAGTRGAPAGVLTVTYQARPNCKRCGGRGIDGHRLTRRRQPDGSAVWERGAPVRCSCCREVRREVTESAGGLSVKETSAE